MYFYLAHYLDDNHKKPLGKNWNIPGLKPDKIFVELKSSNLPTREEVENLPDFSRWASVNK